MNRWRSGAALALTTLTVVPVPSRWRVGVDRRSAGAAMLLAPVVGLLIGAVAALIVAATPRGSVLGPALALLALATLTRGLHLDGLTDTVDGLASYRSPEGALEIMRTGGAGPLGVAALVLVLLVDAGALETAARVGGGPSAAVVGCLAGRLAVPLACTPATRSARTEGLGALVAGTVSPVASWGAALLGVAVAATVGGLAHGSASAAARAAAALLVALASSEVLRRHAVRRLGGITGDVLGALVELGTCAALVVLAV